MTTVLISEWARKAAHNLDMARDAVTTRQRGSSEVHDFCDLKIKGRINHASVLTDPKEAARILEMAREDSYTLQTYLTHLKGTRGWIGNERVPRHAWERHRTIAAHELHYRHALSAALRSAAAKAKKTEKPKKAIEPEYTIREECIAGLAPGRFSEPGTQLLGRVYGAHRRMLKALSQHYTTEEIDEILGEDAIQVLRMIERHVQRAAGQG